MSHLLITWWIDHNELNGPYLYISLYESEEDNKEQQLSSKQDLLIYVSIVNFYK